MLTTTRKERFAARVRTPMMLGPASAAKLHDLLLPATRTAFRAARDAHGAEGLYVFGLYLSASGQVYATFNTRAEGDLPADMRWTPEQFVYHARNRVLFADVGAYLDRVVHDEHTYYLVTNTCVDVLATLDRAGLFGRGAERDGVVLAVFVAGQGSEEHIAFARRLNPPSTLADMESDLLPVCLSA